MAATQVGGRPLAALLAIAAIFAALLLVGPAGTDETRRREQRAWPGLRAADVTEFSVTQGGRTIRATRNGAEWRIDGQRGDAAAIDRLLSAVELALVVN